VRRAVGISSFVIVTALLAPPLGAEAESGIIDQLGHCYAEQAAAQPFSGVAFAVGRDGDIARTAGFIDEGGKAPITLGTRFRLASVQKVLTKTAIGLLVEQKRINLDDPVGKYLPGLPQDLGAATIGQLLAHRGGASSFTRINPEIGRMIDQAKTARELVAIVASQPMSFRPGERQEYSNGGYFLLGAVIEQVSGMSYGDYLAQAIFKPLGMNATSLDADSRTAAPQSKMAFMAARERRGTPAGDGVSTAADLARLGQALVGDKLLSKATREALFPRNTDIWRIGQSGGTMGTNTDLAAFPDNGWVVVVLSNYDPPGGELMAEALRGVILGKGCKTLTEKDRPSRLRMRHPNS
jgi:D-alanyl-D-alanine carboxypeptidase